VLAAKAIAARVFIGSIGGREGDEMKEGVAELPSRQRDR
jgi:hypothetical protein